MKEKNEIKLDNDSNPTVSASKKFSITSLPPNFYRKIIELENKIQLSQPNMDEIKELGSLYKKAIEYFCTSSPNKVLYFQNKLNKLLVGVEKLAKKQNKKKSKWSLYMNSNKKNYNKFRLFLEIEGASQDAEQILQSQNEKFGKIFLEFYQNMDMQKNLLREKMNLKRTKKAKNEINNNIF